MNARLAILTLALCATPVYAQGIQKATNEEVLEAALSAVNGQENPYQLDISLSSDPETGDTIETFTFSGPADEVDAVFGQCQIRLNEEVGYNPDTSLVRTVVDSVPVCGDQYKNMMELNGSNIVTASFAVREYVFQ